jgi:hypothetical protein
MSRPSVKIDCVASNYQAREERIVEWSDPATGAGGLISIRTVDGENGPATLVELYRTDGPVILRHDRAMRRSEK